MREIKFRAWDKKEKKWLNPIYLHITGTGLVYYNSYLNKNIIPVEFTGLKDKNGKEIFEGDILQHKLKRFREYDKKHNRINIVQWGKYEESDGWFTAVGFNFNYFHDEVEVIGNKFENKELLK